MVKLSTSKPQFIGTQNHQLTVEELILHIDWNPYFWTWDLHGLYPDMSDESELGDRARELYHDANLMLERIVSDKLLTQAVFGFYNAASNGTIF